MCRGLSINFSTRILSSPKLDAASWDASLKPSLLENDKLLAPES